MRIETGLLNVVNRIMTAGIPFVPIERVGGAIILASTDRNISSAGAVRLLPDSVPLLRLEKDVVKGGVTISLRTAIGDTGRKGLHPYCGDRTLIHLELQEDLTLEAYLWVAVWLNTAPVIVPAAVVGSLFRVSSRL